MFFSQVRMCHAAFILNAESSRRIEKSNFGRSIRLDHRKWEKWENMQTNPKFQNRSNIQMQDPPRKIRLIIDSQHSCAKKCLQQIENELSRKCKTMIKWNLKRCKNKFDKYFVRKALRAVPAETRLTVYRRPRVRKNRLPGNAEHGFWEFFFNSFCLKLS